MGTRRWLVALCVLACVTGTVGGGLGGCIGYTPSAKRWAYVGDSLLLAGGGGLIALDVSTAEAPCAHAGCPRYTPPVGGLLVAGVLLATAGLVGLVFNATRPEQKTTR